MGEHKSIEILSGTGIYNHPVWSPDSMKIAYDYAPEDFPNDVWTKDVQPEIGVSNKLTSAFQSDSTPEWSPDDKNIAFQSYRTGNWDIWLTSSDKSSEPVQLTTDTNTDQAPVWSPDGKEIAFSVYRPCRAYKTTDASVCCSNNISFGFHSS